MQEFLHYLRTIQFTFSFVCFSVDTVLASIPSKVPSLAWFILPDLIALFLSGYYIITIGKQWNKNTANSDVFLNIFLIILWIIYGSSKAYTFSEDSSGFTLLTVVYGWLNAILYIISATIYATYFKVDF
ncbi:unnamed protein product [Rhizophagus irregularis]|uniref:MARVEL domain-containing protein n=1 Tax=Rhizophagus irregularis TaxID=588596 RepID=A0A2I1GGH9_9GLOM|nr:hypothetical protein RhiirA4_542811 [Rhizophagus irregularis]CAB4411116.1 unnamed protein product [Rhizophagus irregularis]